ncbi:MAG: MFS transporter [Clostridia bacterium]|nr:MFS transporter [Clostridia bacterium]
MEKKQSIGFGFRGWMLIVYQAIAFLTFVFFTNWPMNALYDMYGGQTTVSTIYTVAMIIGIVIQLIWSRSIGKVKNVKGIGIALGIVSLVLALGIMLIPPSALIVWQICYFLECLVVTLWCTFLIGILMGQWFPRRKGTVMGIATFAFPIGNALLAAFTNSVFGSGVPQVFIAFLPYFIVCVIGLLIGAIFTKDYPEQVGCFRDNDRSITPEVAQAMMEQEIKAKETTVWTIGQTFKSRDFWFITLPMGLLLFSAVGMMTQTVSIIGSYGFGPTSTEFNMIMLGVAVVACIGSWLLGVIDTKVGTKKAMLISVIIMTVGGIFGAIQGSFPCLIVALACLAIFMGASSNFTVSGAAQYWRREDFASVFARVNPIANILQAVGPMVLAILIATKGPSSAFLLVGVMGAVSIVLVALFNPKHLKETDDKYRQAAGKPLDDELVGRK